ncbi:MAG: hypothetical protein GWO11_01710 [Desulfuromonadales bacterium]|nr:hypothetical protein [Desulfuromonadales bacterium]
MIGYLRRGKLITAQAFTSNLEGAAASLRAPSGVPDAGPADLGQLISETLALFPDHPPARAQVLYLGQGTNVRPHDLLLERAIRQAQRRGVPVWVVHIPPGPGGGIPEAGRRELPPEPSPAPGSPVSYAEAYLARLSEETGGDTFGLGRQPVGLERYLDRFRSLLDRQYLVEIDAPEPRPGSRLRVEIPRRDLRLLHPRN